MKKLIVVYFCLSVLCVSCGKVDPETRVELDNAEKELAAVTDEYQKKIISLQDPILTHEKEKNEINARYKSYIAYQWGAYRKENGNKKPSEEAFAEFAEDIPYEIFSGLDRISFEYDMNGGWFVDVKSGRVTANIDPKIITK